MNLSSPLRTSKYSSGRDVVTGADCVVSLQTALSILLYSYLYTLPTTSSRWLWSYLYQMSVIYSLDTRVVRWLIMEGYMRMLVLKTYEV